MKITKELSAKISRNFDAKKRAELRVIEDERNTYKAQLAEYFARRLESVGVVDDIGNLLIAALCNYASYYDDNQLRHAADRLVNYVHNDEMNEFDKRIDEVKKRYAADEENFLIAISYSTDLDAIKQVFAEYGLEF